MAATRTLGQLIELETVTVTIIVVNIVSGDNGTTVDSQSGQGLYKLI